MAQTKEDKNNPNVLVLIFKTKKMYLVFFLIFDFRSLEHIFLINQN